MEALFYKGVWPEAPQSTLESWGRVAPPDLHAEDFEQDRYALSDCDALQRHLYYDYHYRILPGHLKRFDHCAMAHGVEARAPFMDWRLACYAFALPADAKISHGFTKRILREALRGIVPEKVRTRQTKIGFSSPLQEWLAGPLLPFLRDSVHSQAFLQSPFSDGPAIRDYVELCCAKGRLQNLQPVWAHIQATALNEIFSTQRWRQFVAHPEDIADGTAAATP